MEYNFAFELDRLERRGFLTTASGLALGSYLLGVSQQSALSDEPPANRQATGVKVGEVTETSAIVWMRVTASANRNEEGVLLGRREALPENRRIDQLRGACPGARGRVRLRYGLNQNFDRAQSTDWVEVTARTDYSHQFRLENLRADSTYYYAAETSGPNGRPMHASVLGRFMTGVPATSRQNVTFTVVTGQAYRDLDDRAGFHIYPAMQRLNPRFIVPTGDTVYYDNDLVLANTKELARHHWHRMYSLPRLLEFHRRVPGYWMKDDHDLYYNDCYPGMRVGRMRPLTFNDGLGLFREQVPMGQKTYRTIRWGRSLQIWLVEGRDFRSANTAPDGPNKTIWGAEQKAWLKRTLLASNAKFKVLISPTPIVGPDRGNKRDNHANRAFLTEGNEIRAWFQDNLPERFVILCGDRHWQYHSIHPETFVHEFSCGPASDRHAGGSPGRERCYHRFHRVGGGFLSASTVQRGADDHLILKFHNVQGRTVYQYQIQ